MIYVIGCLISGRTVLDENGALAQMGERLICIQEVSGSIPLGSTNSLTGIGEPKRVV